MVERAVATAGHSVTYSLLGYTCMAVHDYDQAGQAFSKAVQLKDRYTLAKENRTMCDALKLYKIMQTLSGD